MSLNAERLALVLADADAEDRGNEWFRGKLKDEEQPDGGGEEEGEAEPEDDPLAAIANYPEVSVVEQSLNMWDRCMVSTRDDPLRNVKVYFSDPRAGGNRRGFTVCDVHRCHCWRPVTIQPSREEFLAYMYLWHAHPAENKDAHLRFVPEASEIQRTVPNLVLTPF